MKEYILGISLINQKKIVAQQRRFVMPLVETFGNMMDASNACGETRMGVYATTTSRAKIKFVQYFLNDFKPMTNRASPRPSPKEQGPY